MIKFKIILIFISGLLFFFGCDNYCKNDYENNSPTSGKLKLYCNEGIQLHIKNQVYTFCSLYPHSVIESISLTESESVEALLKDSCKAIIINRLLSENEKKRFEQKNLFPKYSPIAKTGVALITNRFSAISKLTLEQIKQLLNGELILKDSLNKTFIPTAIIDNKNSSVSHYLLDSFLQAKSFGPKCFALNNSLDLIKEISEVPNQIGFIDFAWLSDRDDELFKMYEGKIKFIAIGKTDNAFYEPNQSSFKTGEYPFTRTIYFLRRSDDFTLAKGFEAYIAGPKGQLTFLKQGLLPYRQAERIIEIKMEPLPQ